MIVWCPAMHRTILHTKHKLASGALHTYPCTRARRENPVMIMPWKRLLRIMNQSHGSMHHAAGCSPQQHSADVVYDGSQVTQVCCKGDAGRCPTIANAFWSVRLSECTGFGGLNEVPGKCPRHTRAAFLLKMLVSKPPAQTAACLPQPHKRRSALRCCSQERTLSRRAGEFNCCGR